MRITKVYTKKGDSGQTTIGMGQAIAKTSRRIEAIGMIDELNSVLGQICTSDIDLWSERHEVLIAIQHDLFNLGGELSLPGQDCSAWMSVVDQKSLRSIESLIDSLQDKLHPLKDFVLPGGSLLNALFHVARTGCRRAERIVLALHEDEPLRPDILAYLNRLSDLFFVMSRYVLMCEGKKEVIWDKTTGLKHVSLNSVSSCGQV